MVFPVIMYGCERWTAKKAERRRIDAFELWWFFLNCRGLWLSSPHCSMSNGGAGVETTQNRADRVNDVGGLHILNSSRPSGYLRSNLGIRPVTRTFRNLVGCK